MYYNVVRFNVYKVLCCVIRKVEILREVWSCDSERSLPSTVNQKLFQLSNFRFLRDERHLAICFMFLTLMHFSRFKHVCQQTLVKLSRTHVSIHTHPSPNALCETHCSRISVLQLWCKICIRFWDGWYCWIPVALINLLHLSPLVWMPPLSIAINVM